MSFVAARKRIYVAGPYSHPDPVLNTRAAVLVGEELLCGWVHPVRPAFVVVVARNQPQVLRRMDRV